jgi:isoquinoline 1-oxidoreductase beta subunit
MSTTRRDFLKGSAAGALVIGFTLPLSSRFAQAAAAASGAAAGFAPNAFLRIAPDGQVTVICGLSEMGQGVHMGIASLVAEELDADWKSVEVEQAPADKAYNNPLFGMQATGGSTAIRGHYEPMRKAGAAAREMLVAAAAAPWQWRQSTPSPRRWSDGWPSAWSGRRPRRPRAAYPQGAAPAEIGARGGLFRGQGQAQCRPWR